MLAILALALTDPNARALPISNMLVAKLRWDFYR